MRGTLLVLLVAALTGCITDTANECSSTDDCGPGEGCFAGICLLKTDSSPGESISGSDNPDANPTDDVADDRDSGLPDSGPTADSGDCPSDQIDGCDGHDNDCDGIVDEDFTEDACDTVLLGVCIAGMSRCSDGEVVCISNIEPSDERCDGEDNDCDGETDEGTPDQLGIGQACNTQLSGVCAGGARHCEGGQIVCLQQVQASVEICDGLDNNCDGNVDQNDEDKAIAESCYTGPDQTFDVGACRGGISTCEADTFGACQGEITPLPEICDDVDNDCDGSTDEGINCECAPGEMRDCYNGPQDTLDVGPCRRGSQTCTDGATWGPCAGDQVLPGGEICDGVDNDCDGTVDDVMGVGAVCEEGVGQCVAIGRRQCLDGQLVCSAQAGDGSAEQCNNLDDDCDGSVDEDFDLGQPCQSGQGECVAEGRTACGADSNVMCQASVIAPTNEICDSRDNDCDGETDEGFALGDDCSAGVGACEQVGQLVCLPDGSNTICSARPGEPGEEQCNDLDDDCDEGVDEGLECICVQSNGGVEACDGEDNDCDELIDEGVTNACGNCGGVPAETCDGADNDCDGEVDEALFRDGCYDGPLETIGEGVCTSGTQRCESGRWGACRDQIVPGVEICDGVDNDCDGEVDEDAPDCDPCTNSESRPCYSGPAGTLGAGTCRAGEQTCADMQWDACEGEQLPDVEACNGLDDDCDTRIDEGLGLGEMCQSGLGECRTTGVYSECRDGQLQCNAVPDQPGREVCNDLDDDCDGIPDDGLQCDCEPTNGGVEACDLLDNDCDGHFDEDFQILGQACDNGVGQCVQHGFYICKEGRTACGALPLEPVDEVCDGLDNDCDTIIDEDLPENACGFCGEPPVETCNGSDDDCDGEVDEDAQSLLGFVCVPGGIQAGISEVTVGAASNLGLDPVASHVNCQQAECPAGLTFFQAVALANALSEEFAFTTCYTDDQDRPYTFAAAQSQVVPELPDFLCDGVRLPTHDEWLTLASAGSVGTLPLVLNPEGEAVEAGDLSDVAWADGAPTHEVCTKQPNAYGICDVLGNVGEWMWATGPTPEGRRFTGGGGSANGVNVCNLHHTRDEGGVAYPMPVHNGGRVGVRFIIRR